MKNRSFHVVVLDGYTLAADDLNWQEVQAIVSTTIHDRTPADEIVSRSNEADGLLVNKVTLSAETINQLPKLKYIGVTATGTNIIDLAAAKARDITVTNVPGYSTQSVAQTVFAHLLNLTQRVDHHAEAVRQGRWTRSLDFSFWETPQIEIAGLTMGIFGFGAIGREVAKIALSFGMSVLTTSRSNQVVPPDVSLVDADTLFRVADVVSLHCPLTPQTEGIVSRKRLGQMKSSAFLINTARGPLIDEAALADALHAGQIAGAGLDVLSVEPPPADHPLLTAPNCFITPHYAWGTRSARTRLMHEVAQNLEAYLADTSRNIVS